MLGSLLNNQTLSLIRLVPIVRDDHLSYPRLDQPRIRHPVTGRTWVLEVSSLGVLTWAGTTSDPAWTETRLQLVSQDRTVAWAFGIGAGQNGPNDIVLTQLPGAQYGRFEDLYAFSPTGREWAIQVTAAGVVVVKSMGSVWFTRPLTVVPTAKAVLV